MINPASRVPLRVLDQRGELEPIAAEYRERAAMDHRKKGTAISLVTSQGSASKEGPFVIEDSMRDAGPAM